MSKRETVDPDPTGDDYPEPAQRPDWASDYWAVWKNSQDGTLLTIDGPGGRLTSDTYAPLSEME